MNRLKSKWLLVIVLCLTTSIANATDCKKIIAKVGPAAYLSDCSYNDVDYVWCIDSPLKGNLLGTWHYLSSPDWNAFDLTVPDGALGIPGWDLWVVWSLMVVETNKGDIIAAENEILNLDAFDNFGAISGMAFIVGGTGNYEGATGWMGFVGTETEGGVLRGEVCTP